MTSAGRRLVIADFLYSPEHDTPLRDHAVLLDAEGTILSVGPVERLRDEGDERTHCGIVMPGVLNCHIHLTDAARIATSPGGNGLVEWVRGFLADRSQGRSDEELREAATRTLEEMAALGTVAVGEVANNETTLDSIRRSKLHGRFIHELIAFRSERADEVMAGAERVERENDWSDRVRHSLGAHAPYSVSPALMVRIDAHSRSMAAPFFQHLAEDPDERELYVHGTGPWRDFLMKLGAWDPGFTPPGVPPVELYDRLGVLGPRFIAVHLADASDAEIRLLAARGVKAILSPTSNLHITGLLPRARTIADAGMVFALGTDGRGSNPSIDVFDEARLLLEHFPDLPPGTLLRALTAGGAEVLSFAGLGRLAVGTKPGLIGVDGDAGSGDLREIEKAMILGGASPGLRNLTQRREGAKKNRNQHPEL